MDYIDLTTHSTTINLDNNCSNMTNYTQQDINLNTTYQFAKFICYQVIGIPLSLLGIIGNLLSILVWTRKRMQWGTTSTPRYLAALAISDTLYLLLINIILLLPGWMGYDSENGCFYSLFAEEIYPIHIKNMTESIINVLSNISIYYMVVFTMERFIAIYYPIRGRTWCTPRRASYVIIIVSLAVATLHIPDFIEKHTTDRKTLSVIETPAFQLGFNWGIMALLFAVVPLLILITVNLLLIRMVLLSRKKRKVMRSHHRRQQDKMYAALTVTIILIVVVFSICQTPAATILIIYTYLDSATEEIPRTEDYRWKIAFVFANFLSIFNSSINFMLYSASSKRFRRTLFATLCPMKHNKKLQSKSNYYQEQSSLRTSQRGARNNDSSKRLLNDEMVKSGEFHNMESENNNGGQTHRYISKGQKTNGPPTNV